jgi:hypothetical protein
MDKEKRTISTEQSGVVMLLVGAGHPLVMKQEMSFSS